MQGPACGQAWAGWTVPLTAPSTGHAPSPLAGGEPALGCALRGLQEDMWVLRCAGGRALRVVRRSGGPGWGWVGAGPLVGLGPGDGLRSLSLDPPALCHLCDEGPACSGPGVRLCTSPGPCGVCHSACPGVCIRAPALHGPAPLVRAPAVPQLQQDALLPHLRACGTRAR